MARQWRMTSKQVVGVAHCGSGNPENDFWLVRIRWSKKLGLTLDHTFHSKKMADDVADKVAVASHITRGRWAPEYYPWNGFETSQRVD